MQLRRALIVPLTAPLLAVIASGPMAPIEAFPQKATAQSREVTLKEARKFLEGMWGLESLVLHLPGKEPIQVKASGTLVYDQFSNLKMEIRADQGSSDLLRTLGIDIRDGVISTNGRTALDRQNRKLTYFLEGQDPLIPGPLDMRHPRYWEVDGDVLILTTKDEAGRPLSVGRWKKHQR
jgi:hypothetical protein